MKDDCNHLWISNNGMGGKPTFRKNGRQTNLLTMRVACRKCRRREWYTEKKWKFLPSHSKGV